MTGKYTGINVCLSLAFTPIRMQEKLNLDTLNLHILKFQNSKDNLKILKGLDRERMVASIKK